MRRIYQILMMLTSVTVMAQQDPLLNHNVYHQMAINPAFAGSKGLICATAINRQQWIGFGEGSPMTTSVMVDAPISPFGFNSGVGLNILHDRFGFNQDINVNLSYAARFSIPDAGSLSIGVNGGFINNTLNPNWKFPDSSGDVIVPAGKQNAVNFDLGAGVFFHNNDMFFGISATHLNEPKFFKLYTSHYKRHFYLTGGYYLQLPNQNWMINPTILINSDLVINQLTFGSSFIYNKKFWGGVSYRVGESVTGILGFELFSGLRIGYAYDFSTNGISSYNSGSHELLVGYSFSLKRDRPPQQYKSIRFL